MRDLNINLPAVRMRVKIGQKRVEEVNGEHGLRGIGKRREEGEGGRERGTQ